MYASGTSRTSESRLYNYYSLENLLAKLTPASSFFATAVVVVTPPLPRDGGMAEDHGAPEAGQLRRDWTSGRKGTVSRQRASGAKSP